MGRASLHVSGDHIRGTALATALMVLIPIGAVAQQGQAAPQSNQITSEDLEPRTIGSSGTTLVGIAGYVDKFSSSEDALPGNYTVHVDVTHFLTDRLAVRGGLVGTGSFGDDDSDQPAGIGAPALHGTAGAQFYFTPQSMLSLYSGIDYWAQLTQRADSDAGSLIGTLGVQGAMSSRASIFLEGGYGFGLSKVEEDETLRRFVARVGVRLKF
ncbi:MAG TPA: hypothetical protein VFS23_01350 [Vicinamibacterales bacterium]|nr:hypothetical protein [Vicinamibacterales bacterium]